MAQQWIHLVLHSDAICFAVRILSAMPCTNLSIWDFALCRVVHGFFTPILISMSLFRRTGFNRQGEGTTVNTAQQRANGSPNPSPTTFSPTMPSLNQSASSSSNTGSVTENGNSNAENQALAEPPKFFFQERFAKLGVKGNFMPLAAQPTNVELADWLAHQSEFCDFPPLHIRYVLMELCCSRGASSYRLHDRPGHFRG